MTAGELARPVCIVTAGGDAPGLDAVLRAFAHRAYQLGLPTLACRNGFEGMLTSHGIAPFGLESVRGILPLGGSALGCSTRVYPFLRDDVATSDDPASAMLERLRAAGARALVVVGGDGSSRAARRFHALGMPCLVVAKTIDCDLGELGRTCGHDTAVQTVTSALDALHATTESHRRVMIVEVMGRHAGWIALRGGIAGGADVILLPEVPYDVVRVARKVKEREALGRAFTIVVVGEGARPAGGEEATVETAAPGRLARLGGAGERLRRELEALDLGHEVRVTVLGHLQRGGAPVATDRLLGTQLGVAAAEACRRGELGGVLAVRGARVVVAPFDEVLGAPGTVLPMEPLLDVARGVGIDVGR